MSVIESLKWRRAIKIFDPSQKVTKANLEALLESANLTATSGGIQPFVAVSVSDPNLKSQMLPHTFGQSQVVDCSDVIILAIETDFDTEIVDRYIERAAKIRGQDKQNLISYADSMKYYISTMDDHAKFNWAKNQAFIALGTLLTVAAEMRIDSCPMEGFNPIEFQKILNLESKKLMPVVILAIGYRSPEDLHSKEQKIRKNKDEFVISI